MIEARRWTLRRMGVGAAIAGLWAAGVLRPTAAIAAAWNKGAFEAKSLPDALKGAGVDGAATSTDIVLTTPTIAENGAVVPVSVLSNLADTTSISIFVEKNPFPMACTFDFSNGAVPEVGVRLKFADTSVVRAVVTAGGKSYAAAKEVKVTAGGCGG